MVIGDEYRKCVVFLFADVPDEETQELKRTPAGTAFLAGVPAPGPPPVGNQGARLTIVGSNYGKIFAVGNPHYRRRALATGSRACGGQHHNRQPGEQACIGVASLRDLEYRAIDAI